MELKGKYVYFSCRDWELAGFSKPPGFDMSAHGPNDLITTVPFRTTPQAVAETQELIGEKLDERVEAHNLLCDDPDASDVALRASYAECVQTESLIVCLGRLAEMATPQNVAS